MSAETTELKAVVTVETRAEAQIDRLQRKIDGLIGRANKTFANPLDTVTAKSNLVSKAFERHRGTLQDFGRAQRDWANDVARAGKMTGRYYDQLSANIDRMVTKSGDLRKGVNADHFVRAVRSLNAYVYVWNRHHDGYKRNLVEQGRLHAQIEDKKLYLAQRANERIEKSDRARDGARMALDRQRTAAYLKGERDKASAAAALGRQRTRAYVAQIREEERAGRKAEADRLRGEVRKQRQQESARRSLERQRSQAYLREINEQEAAERKRQAYLQRLKNSSWARQMRQEAAARREEDRAMRARGRQFGVDTRRTVRGLGMVVDAPGRMAAGLAPVAAYSGVAAAAVAAGIQKGLSSRMSVEAAETNLRMFGGELARPGREAKNLSAADVAEIRTGWLDESSIGSGVSPATGLGVLTEVIKAGINDPKKYREMTELVLGASAGMDMNTRETTRVLGRVATNVPGIDSARMKQIMNAMAIAAGQTAADPDEIVSGMDRGMGAISLGLSPEDLAAWVATGRSTGIQAAKTGNFISTLLQKGVNGKNLRGQAGRDMDTAAQMLRMGSARGMSRRAVADPNAWLEEVFEKVEAMSVDKRSKLSSLMGGQEWDDEILQMKQGLQTLKETRAAIKDERNKNFLDDNKDLKNASLRGLNARMRARFSLLWETFGDGFSTTFEEVAKWFIISGRAVNLGGLRTVGQSLMVGLVNGLGFDTWTKALDHYFGQGQFDWGDINDKVFRFARGFGKGMKEVYETVRSMLGMVGGDKMDAESLGELTAKILGLSLGLQIASPGFRLLGVVKDGLLGLAGALYMLSGALGVLGLGSVRGLGAKVLGGLGVRAFGGVAGAVGSAAVGQALGALGIGASLTAALAGGILIAGLAAGVAAIAVTVMNWDAISGWFSKFFRTDKLPVDDKDPKEVAPYLNHDDQVASENPFAGISPAWEGFKSWWRGNLQPEQSPRVQQQSYSGSAAAEFRAMLHHASYGGGGGVDDLKRSIDKMGAHFELASLIVPGLAGAAGGIGGVTGGSGSYGLSGSGISPSDPAQRYGKRFFSLGGGGGSDPVARAAPQGPIGDRMKSVYQAFRSAGLGHDAAKSFAAEIGRENGYDANLMYGSHIDPHNGKRNAGMMSWQGSRAAALLDHLRAGGHLNADGSIKPTQEALNAQAAFAIKEMEDGSLGPRGQRALQVLRDPTSTHAQRALTLGDDVIKWRQHDPRYAHHATKRDQYYGQLGGLTDGGSNKIASIDPNGVAVPGLGSGVGQYDGLRLKSREAIAGGAAHVGITDLARQAQENLPGGVARFSAFNDAFHHRVNPRSKHTQGLAFDTSLSDPRQHAAAAEAMRAKLRAAGLDEGSYRVIDEYAQLSGHGTGGHIHTQFNSAEAAQKYHDYVASLGDADKATAAVAGPMAAAAAKEMRAPNVGDAADIAGTFEGMDESKDHRALSKFMGREVRGNVNAWCASFVDASLKAAGITGTNSAIASDFMKWGKEVEDKSQIKKGDVLVEDHRDQKKGAFRPGMLGGHANMATGKMKTEDGKTYAEVISGNRNNSVVREWLDVGDAVSVRRALAPSPDLAAKARAGSGPSSAAPGSAAADGAPQNPAERMIKNVPTPAGGPGQAGAQGGRGDVFHVTQNINGYDKSPKEIADMSQRHITEAWNHRAHDLEAELT